MKRFAVAVGLVAAVLSMCALARADNALQPTVISLAQFSVTATPTDQAHQDYVFALSSKTGDTSYVFEVAQDAGGAILLLIAGNRTSVDQETKLESRHHERTKLSLRPIPPKTSRTGKALSHELVSIKWSGAESNETAEAESFQDPRLKKLYSDLRTLVNHHYPDATIHWLRNKISFEFNTRVFIIHVPLKTGEWQDPWEQRGPKKGGIYGIIELRDGLYRGAAMVPQTFDKRYYSTVLMAPYSEEHDCHLYVHLYTPRLESKADFIKEFSELVNGFADKLGE